MNSGMSFSKNRLCVPDGFPTLLEKLAMEVIRTQPKNIVQFAADYLNQLIEQGEKFGVDYTSSVSVSPTRSQKHTARIPTDKESKAASKIQKNYHQHYLRRCESATIIQASYRGYRIRKSLPKSHGSPLQNLPSATKDARLDASVTKIQASFRGFQARKSLQRRADDIQSLPHDKELEEAATKLQASFRGFKTRKALQKSTQNNSKVAENDSQHEVSATKIQASYRGYKVRKEMKQKQRELEVKAFLNEAEDAAIIIQKNYRGYCTRRNMKKKD